MITIENASIQQLYDSHHHNFVSTTTSAILEKVRAFIPCDFEQFRIKSEVVAVQVSGSLYIEARAICSEPGILMLKFGIVPFVHVKYHGSPNVHDGIDALLIPLSHYSIYTKFEFTDSSDVEPIQRDIARIIAAIISGIEFETRRTLIRDDIELLRDGPSRISDVWYRTCRHITTGNNYSERTDSLLRVFKAIAKYASGTVSRIECESADAHSTMLKLVKLHCRKCQQFFIVNFSRYLLESDRL